MYIIYGHTVQNMYSYCLESFTTMQARLRMCTYEQYVQT